MKRNKQNTLLWLYALFFTVTTAISAVFFAFLYTKNADLTDVDGVYTTVLFKTGAVTSVYTVFVCLCLLVFFSAFLVFRKNAPKTAGPTPKTVLLFLRAAAGLFILSTDFMLYKLSVANTPFDNTKLRLVMTVLAIPAALYFLIPVFSERIHQRLRCLFGAGVVGWLCAQALCIHFFMLDFLNSPTRTLGLLSICALVFFFLSDVPYRVSGTYIAYGMAAGFLAITDGGVKLFLSLTGQAGFSSDINIFFALCKLTLGLYAAVCTVALLLKKQAQDAEEPIVEEVAAEMIPKESAEEIDEIPEETAKEEAAEAIEEAAPEAPDVFLRQEASNENAVGGSSDGQENI